MKRFGSAAFVPATVVATRSMRDAKGITEMRVVNQLWSKQPPEALVDYKKQLDGTAHPNPSNRKEAMAHLTVRPGYEYIPEFQRWANDMMAIYTEPASVTADMSYHYCRVWKALCPNHTWMADGSGSIELIKVKPTI